MKKRLVLLTIVLLLVGIVIIFVYRLRTTPNILAMPSGELAFTSYQDGTWDIVVLDGAGVLTNLTAGEPEHDYFASFAFSNDMVNFLTGRTGVMGPGQVKPDGTDLKTLSITQAVMSVFVDSRIDWDPAWSPDGQKMIWSSVRDLNLEIYLAEGDDRQRLTNDGGRDWFASWSPDGQRIAFSSDRNGLEDIYIIELASGALIQVTDHPANDFYAVWSLDGQSLLFVSERDQSLTTGNIGLFIVDVSGEIVPGNERLLGEDEVFKGDPTYSADGEEVAYMSNEGGTWSIYLMDADGSNIRQVSADDTQDLYPVWRPLK